MKENKHWLGATTSSVPRRTLRKQLIDQNEERRVMIRKQDEELTFLDWQIWLTKDNLSRPYKKMKGW